MAILSRVESHGRVYIRHVKDPVKLEDFLAEMVALSREWTTRIAQWSKHVTRLPSALTSYAARAMRSGRRLCGQAKGKDALSPLARQRRGLAGSTPPQGSRWEGNRFDQAWRTTCSRPWTNRLPSPA